MDAEAIGRQIDRLERGFGGWTLAEGLHAVRQLRGAAAAAGLEPLRAVADALVDAIARDGRAIPLADWAWLLREAGRLSATDRDAGPALIATMAIRYAA